MEEVNVDNFVFIYDMLLQDALEKYPKYSEEIQMFLLNTILVLHKARPSYRIDIPVNLQQYMISLIFTVWGNVLDIINVEEPVLYLKGSNVADLYKYGGEENMGKILGYCYQSADWMSKVDKYIYHPLATGPDGLELKLFGTAIPKSKLSSSVVACLAEQVAIYDSILSPFGYVVRMGLYFYPKKEFPYYHENRADDILAQYV